MQNHLCLASNYLVMSEATRQMWIDLDRQLDKCGSRLVLLNTVLPDPPLPFPVIPISFLLRDYARNYPGALSQGGTLSPTDFELLENDSARAEGSYPPAEASSGLIACRNFVSSLVATLRPSHILAWDSTSPLASILQAAACQNNLPFHAIERGLLPETLAVESRGIFAFSDLRSHWLAQNIPAADPAAYEQIRSYYLQHKPQKYDQPAFGGGGAEVRERLGLGNRKVLVFFGHYDACGLAPRSGNQRRYHSPAFSSTQEALMAVWSEVEKDPDIALVFKPHPIDRDPYAIAKIEGVHVVRDENPHALIDLADAVVAQLTTLQFEAALYDKPVVLMGNSAWSGRDATYEVASRDELRPALRAALKRTEWKKISANARSFLTWSMENFHIGCTSSVPTRRKLSDFAKFIVRTSMDCRNLPSREERWEQAQAVLRQMESGVPFRPAPCAPSAPVRIEPMSFTTVARTDSVPASKAEPEIPCEPLPGDKTDVKGFNSDPLLDDGAWNVLHAQAREATAAGNLSGAFLKYRHLLGAAARLLPAQSAMLAQELAQLVPQVVATTSQPDLQGFLRALELHPGLATELAGALGKEASGKKAALVALGISSAGAGRYEAALEAFNQAKAADTGTPELQPVITEFIEIASTNLSARRANGWASRRPTPFPIAPDGKPKLSPVWFEVTSFCNQTCSFCPDQWRQTKRQFINLEVFKKCVDELKRDFHVEYLQLNAYGEPLLHPQFEQMLTYLREGHAPCPFFFTTHGMTLNDKNIAMLDRAHPYGICVSLQNDCNESYAASRDVRLGDYDKLARQCRNLVERFVQNRRACHVRLYQLVRNGKEGFGVPDKVLSAFPGNWERFASSVRRWEESLRPLADNRSVFAVRNTDDQIREAFEQADHPAWWVKLDLLRWKDQFGGEQSAFICPRPVGTYANQLPHHTDGWQVSQETFNSGGCFFTRKPGLAIFSNGNLGVCCLSVDQNAAFGKLQDFGSIKAALSSEACFRMFAELSNGVARSPDCKVCLGRIEQCAGASAQSAAPCPANATCQN